MYWWRDSLFFFFFEFAMRERGWLLWDGMDLGQHYRKPSFIHQALPDSQMCGLSARL